MSSLYPINVNPDEKQIQRLILIFRRSYKRVYDEIATASDFGVANRRAILKQIDGILVELGDDVQNFVDDNLPGYYRDGSNDAIKQLKNTQKGLTIKTGFNQLHKEAIIALVDDTVGAYFESITGVKRSANLLLGRATREAINAEIAQGKLTGEALRKVRQNIKGLLQEQGLSALTDKRGRKWKLDTYAEMLYRTKVVEARNMGFSNRLVDNGYDLVQVSDHLGECELCRPWEGKILSVTGSTSGYPTLAKATNAGLFHPNCRHAINLVTPSLARKTRAYDPDKKQLVKKPGESLNRKTT